MNDKILAQKLRSIAHYTQEVASFEAAAKTTQETRKDLIDSLAEFFPFQPGDIIANGDKIRKVVILKNVSYSEYSGFRVFYNVEYIFPDNRGGLGNAQDVPIYLEDIASWKVISVS